MQCNEMKLKITNHNIYSLNKLREIKNEIFFCSNILTIQQCMLGAKALPTVL